MQQWKIKALTYLASILVYRWYALAAAWALCLMGWGVVAAMPDQYTAEAKVYIDTESLMDPLLRGLTVSIDPAQEIAVMLKTLITRPTLEQVVRITDPAASKLTPIQLEERVLDLQNRISIRGLDTRNYYAVGYTDNDAQYATAVTQSLLSIMQDSRVGGTRLDMDTARNFIAKKVQEYEDRLRDADKRRADFRTANLEILSKGVAANRITAADAAYEQAKKDLNSATVRRDSVKEQLATMPKTVPIDERMFLGSTLGGMPAEGAMRTNGTATEAPVLSNPVQRLEQAQQTLAELRIRFTESHPDVIAQKKLIAQLQAQITDAPDKDKNSPDHSSVMVPNSVYTQLQAKLSDEETNVAVQRQRVSEAASELAKAKQEASLAIDVQARYDGLDRDYGNIQKTYAELLQSRESASLSQARDDQNQGVSFRVLEPPQKPRIPAAPNRLALNSAVLLLGLGGGAAVAILLALYSGRFFTSEDITAQFGIPLIGVITALPQPFGTRRSRISAVALSVSFALLLLGYVGVVTVLRTSIYSVLGVLNG
ncbi:MAG TPA: XrtA system polysaccharide chain length determinant [Micropepsaceae bacterium]|nr:XrtA system polysaccharide chain length determinant [Micropepsaceae bacterium]